MLRKALDKLTLNTEIVSMRHATRRARVHVISKLVREAKKLRIKKGTDAQRKKYQRKADRITEEVFIIKKLKDDDISKSALMNTHALEEVISDATVTLQTRALARLANHHHLKIRVNELRTKYPTWAETIPQLLPQLGAKKKKKSKEKNKRKGVVAENTVIEDNDHNDIKSNNSNNDKENSTEIEKNVEVAKCEVTSEKKQKQKKAPKKDSTFQNDQDADKNIEHKSQRRSGIGEVKRFTELLKEETSESDDKECDNKSESHFAEDSTKSDPFFLHGDDDNNDDDDDDESMQDDKETKMKSKEDNWEKLKPMGPNRRQRRQQLFGSKTTNVGFKNVQRKPKKGFTSRTEHTSTLRKKEQPVAPQDTDVHPSWEAKRKLKEQQQAIFAFKGKKIKFDDE